MGEMKSGARGVHGSAGRPGEDPFVELAEMFEADIGRDAARRSPAHRAPPTAYDFDGRHLDAVDRAFDEAFEDVLSADLGHSTAQRQARVTATTATAYRTWLSPKTAPMGSPHVSLALDDNLEDAIHNLSAPANPRNTIVVETQSFAPDRVVEDYRHESVTPELDDFDELIASEMAVMNDHTGYVQQQANAAAQRMAEPENVEAWYQAAGGQPHSGTAPHYDPNEYAYDEAPAEPARRGFLARRGMVLGAGVMSLALVGALGVYVLGGNRGGVLSGDDGALLIKADAEPYKVAPKDPGGRSIPNQNKAVYDRVANPGTDPATKQKALLTDSEEPMDLPAEEPPQPYDALPGVELGEGEGLDIKSEDRVETAAAGEPTDDEAETAILQPRKVRTMVVRPDGTLVASDAEGAAQSQGVSANGAATSALIEAASRNPVAATVRETVQPVTVPQTVAEVGVPVQIADPIQVAAIPSPPPPVSRPPAAVQASPASENSYFVQISSQPSEALAQQSMQNLGSRFASVIEGRTVGIKSAEIPGKGTFYRVRVAAASKQEANELCSRLKSAGGNCFVAR